MLQMIIEEYKTLHLNINPNKLKKQHLEELIKQSTEIANKHFQLIKSNRTFDYQYIHEVLYKECRGKYPNFLASSIQLIRDHIIEKCRENQKLLKRNKIYCPLLLRKEAFKLSNKSTKYFDAWLVLQGIAYPLEGKEVIQKLVKMGLCNDQQKYLRRKKRETEVEILSKTDLPKVKLDKEYEIKYASIRRNKNKLKLYLTVCYKKEKPIKIEPTAVSISTEIIKDKLNQPTTIFRHSVPIKQEQKIGNMKVLHFPTFISDRNYYKYIRREIVERLLDFSKEKDWELFSINANLARCGNSLFTRSIHIFNY